MQINTRPFIIKAPFLLLIVMLLHATYSEAVPAYPETITYTQPNGTVVSIQLKGDERVHWAETKDGYTLLHGAKGGWEYAIKDVNGNMVASGVSTGEIGKRNQSELRLLKTIPKKLFYSKEQVKQLTAKASTNYQTPSLRLPGISNVIGVSTQKPEKTERVFTPLGNKKLLLLLIQFADVKFSTRLSEFDGLMNGVNYTQNGAEGSVADYFEEVSYNKFHLSTDVFGVYTASHERAYYGANDESGDDVRANDLMSEAILQAEANGVDFSQYDNDGDGTVDGVYVIYAGYGEATSGIDETIWPHAGSISPALQLDGKSISKYSCSNELNTDNSITTIGVICHEFGHVCGAPDYYDIDYEDGGSFEGTGSWDLMATGVYNKTPGASQGGNKPAHVNPLVKINAGWLDPLFLNKATSLVIPDITTNPIAYIYNTATPNECYILENRQLNGFNTGCKGSGLMVYHYSESVWNTSGNATFPQGFYPVCASSTTNPTTTSGNDSYGNINSSGCPFPGSTNNTTFGDLTIPSSRSWAGENINSPLFGITENNGLITLNFKAAPTVNPILVFSAKPISESRIDLTWTKNAAHDAVVIAANTSDNFGEPANGVSYSAGSSLPNGGTVVYAGSANGFMHTGLTPSTTYYYKIWSVDSNGAYSESNAQQTQTAKLALTKFPLIDSFESGLPEGWTQEFVSGENEWEIGTKGINSHPTVAHTGLKLAKLSDLTWGDFVTKLVSPPLDLSGATHPTLRFWHTQQNWNSYQDVLRVMYKTNASDSWKQLAIYPNSIDTWTMESIELPEVSSTYYIAFEGSTNSGYGICMDDIEIWKNNTETVTWTGAKSTDWFDAANWSSVCLPTLTTDVVIPSGVPNNPYLVGEGAVCRHFTINNGATLGINSSLSDTLFISGNWTNNGTFNCGKSVVVFAETSTDQRISGTSTSTFYTLQLKKGLQSNVLEALSPITLIGPASTTSPLNVSSGTFKLSSNSTIIPFKNGTTLLSDGGLWNNGGTINLSSSLLYLSGLLRNTAGTTTINQVNIYGDKSMIDIQGGEVIINTTLKPYNSSSSYTTTYNQSGGTLTLLAKTADSRFMINNPSSTFNMSGGKIIITSISDGDYDYINLSENGSITGGTLQIGGSSTTGSPAFVVNTKAPVYDFTINSTGTPSVMLAVNDLTALHTVELQTGTKLDANNQNIMVGGDWLNAGQFTPREGSVYLDGTTAQHLQQGTNYTFNNLVVANTMGVTYSATVPLTVNGTLLIDPASKLEIEAGSALTTNRLKNNAGTNGLRFKNGPTTYATWLNTGPSEAQQATVEFTLTDKHPTYFSSPINDGTASAFAPLTEQTVSYFDEATKPAAFVKVTNNESLLLSGKGYLLHSTTTGSSSLSGTLNDGEQSFVLKRTNPDDVKAGFNLVGNPYPSFVQWDDVLKTNIAPSIWTAANNADGRLIIETYSGGVGTNNGGLGQASSLLKPMQGFWVKVGNETNQGSFVLQNSVRSHAVTPSQSTVPTIRLNVSNGSQTDETVLAIKTTSTDAFDAEKLSNDTVDIPELYSIQDSKPLAINFLTDFDYGKCIPLGFKTGKSGTFSITCTQLSPLGLNTVLLLKDSVTNSITPLNANTSYSFTSNDTTINDRFQLIFADVNSTTNLRGVQEQTLLLFQESGRRIGIQSTATVPTNTMIYVYDALGQLKYKQTMHEGLNVTETGFEQGIYLVSIQNGQWKINRKILLN